MNMSVGWCLQEFIVNNLYNRFNDIILDYAMF